VICCNRESLCFRGFVFSTRIPAKHPDTWFFALILKPAGTIMLTPKLFRMRTSKRVISVHSKGLTGLLSPLESALTKKPGEGPGPTRNLFLTPGWSGVGRFARFALTVCVLPLQTFCSHYCHTEAPSSGPSGTRELWCVAQLPRYSRR